jgi:hypothetical protein
VYSSANAKIGGVLMSQNPDVQIPLSSAPTLTTCFNCHSAMPSELRFCRNCGFRLGEGVAEYNDTVRFDGTHGPMVSSPAPYPAVTRKRRRMSGMAWVFVALLVFFVGAAAFTAILSPSRQRPRANIGFIAPPTVKSYLGVNGFDTADNDAGVTFDRVEAPDTPADKAGLVGGDIITKVDGQDIRDEDQMSELMERTPIGKTVDIEYLRDGEKKTTKLTTISADENRRLTGLFEKRPEGRAMFGYDNDNVDLVEVPGTKLKGVKFGRITRNGPADLAGVKSGDIVVEFEKIPIRSKGELLMRVRRALPYSTVNLVVYRGAEGSGQATDDVKEESTDKAKEETKLEKIPISVKVGKQ